MMRPRPARYLITTAVLMASLTVAGCGEDADEPPAVCSAVDSLKASVEDVTTVDLGQGALAELQDNVTQVQSDITQVKDDAKDEYATEIDALDQATASISTSLEAAIATPSAQAITDLGAAIEALGTSLTSLEDAVRSTC